jgi:hypothetical protein
LDLADLFPPIMDVSQAPATGHELVTQLRLLHSTVGIKLDQFDRAPRRGVPAMNAMKMSSSFRNKAMRNFR